LKRSAEGVGIELGKRGRRLREEITCIFPEGPTEKLYLSEKQQMGVREKSQEEGWH